MKRCDHTNTRWLGRPDWAPKTYTTLWCEDCGALRLLRKSGVGFWKKPRKL